MEQIAPIGLYGEKGVITFLGCFYQILLILAGNDDIHKSLHEKSNRKAMNRNWSNQKANPALKTNMGNK